MVVLVLLDSENDPQLLAMKMYSVVIMDERLRMYSLPLLPSIYIYMGVMEGYTYMQAHVPHPLLSVQ